MDRIARAVLSSKYSIHDLSRCRGEGNEGLARFNMPLELGIAIGRRMVSGSKEHDWLVLAPENHRYIKFISDLGGFDLKTHDGTVEGVISRVIGCLATRPDVKYAVRPNQVLAALPRFEEIRRKLTAAWYGEVPWVDLILAARECVPE